MPRLSNWNLCLVALTAFWFASPAGAERASPKRPEWQRDRAALDQRYLCEEFRIHYTLEGKNALPDEAQRDSDGDGVPDRIQNHAIQLLAARHACVDVLGLRHPFESPRYKGRVKYLDVNVWALPTVNGMAGDAIVNYHRDNDPPEGVDVITVDLSTKLTDRNLTPAHELFHVFQNGYTLFKTPWYYEGMARWSESLLRAGPGESGLLPGSAPEVDDLVKLSYGASGFWLALARAVEPSGKIRLPPHLAALRYVGAGDPVFEDDDFHGGALLKALLEELDRQDDLASKDAGLDPLDWPEERQRSAENTSCIWRAVIATCRRLPSSPPQLCRTLEEASGIGPFPPRDDASQQQLP